MHFPSITRKIKKQIAQVSVFFYMVQIFSGSIVFATGAGEFDLSTFSAQVNSGNQIAGDIQGNPGDTYNLRMYTDNVGTTDITNVRANFTFSSSNFTYLGGAEKKCGNDAAAVLTSGEFNPSSLSSASLCPQLAPDGELDIIQKIAIQTRTQYALQVTGIFQGDGANDSDPASLMIYTNVKPHITDYYFEKPDGSTTTNQIQGSQAEMVNLVMKVKDYNGCSNVSSGSLVTADLSSLGLSSSEPLTYLSCSSDGQTAIFKKMSITTLAPLGDKTFLPASFVVTNKDGNTSDSFDTRFGNEDKKANLVLTVVPPAAPTTLLSASDLFIGSPSKPSTTLTFSGSQNGEYKVTLGSDGECNSGAVLADWTGSGSYSANSNASTVVQSSSLVDGANSVVVCMRNIAGKIGSANATITKDTVAPMLSRLSISPASVTTANSSASYMCDEDGQYQVELGGSGTLGAGTFVGSGITLVNQINTQTINNALLVNGRNPLSVYCIDKAGNSTAYAAGAITKTPPTPSLAGAISSFSDNDIDFDSIDGHDFSLTWSTGALAGFDYFESYRLYILPAATAWSSTQTYAALIANKNTNTWTGLSNITKDALGNSLISGNSYKMCVGAMSTSGFLGTEDCSTPAIITADIVTHPVVTGAAFIDNNTLELTTNATLDTNLVSNSGTLITFQYNALTYTGTIVSAVSGKKISITIPSLGNVSATGGNLLIQTGAIHAFGGGFNNLFSLSGLIIADGQNPTISGYSVGTTPTYSSFYKGNLVVNYTFNETMSGGGNTSLVLSRISGNADTANHSFPLTGSDIASGVHAKTVNLDNLGLVSGTTYTLKLIGKDVAGNTANVVSISNIAYDNVGPDAPRLILSSLFGSLSPSLGWYAALDNANNGSGIQKYVLQVFSGNTCSINQVQIYPNIAPNTLSQVLSTLPNDKSNYSWSVYAMDNMNNTGAVASCGNFRVDSTVPAITAARVYNQTLDTTAYTRNTDMLQVSATIPNTDASHIWIDATSLAGGPGYNHVACDSPTGGIICTYLGNTVTYMFLAGFVNSLGDGVRQVTLSAQNTSGGNNQSSIISITADNTVPVVTPGSLLSPNGGETWSGSMQNIRWNTSGITDTIGVKDIVIEYATGAGNWNNLGTIANNGTYNWNITALEDRNDYKVRLTAIDYVGHTTSLVSVSDFTIDKTAPTIVAGTLLVPNTKNIYKGGQSITVTWNAANITDTVSLAVNPIALEYSSGSGATWTTLSNTLPNSGSYNWTIPTINSASVLVRLTARDTAGNRAPITSTETSIIDSIAPTQTVTFAGNGGATPANNKSINNSGLDISATSTDTYLDTVTYQFVNATDNLAWDATSTGWTSTGTWNTLCTDGAAFGTNNACDTINATINPDIIDGKNYSLILRSTDEAGNITTSSIIHYTGDTTAPNLTMVPVSSSYLSGSIVYSGTAADTGSSVSSVKVQVQKGSEYWDGANWVATAQLLSTTTTDGYATWQYDFVPPLVDPDGQSYTVTAIAYDSAYKTDNNSNLSRTVIKDTTGPTIDANVFTFSTGGIRKGAVQMNITWNPASVTTSGAPLDTNPISLSYNFTGTVTPIATNIPNTGSYSFLLPMVDTTTAKIIISAVDSLGNPSTPVASSNFTIDSIPPSVQSVQTLDGSAIGKIDSLLVHFSERVQNIDSNGFQINSGAIAITGWSWAGVIGNEDTITLSFIPTGTSADTPTLAYDNTAAEDIAGNPLTTGMSVSTDGAVARIMGADIFDQNHNGKLDQIQVHFSENLTPSTTFTGWTLNNAFPGMSITSVSTAANTLLLNLSESTTENTDASGLTLSLVNTAYTDLAGNTVGNFTNQVLTDRAAPILVLAKTVDADNNGKIDEIQAVFSESLSGVIASDISINNLATGSVYTGNVNLSGAIATFNIGETTLVSDSGQIPTLSYTPGNLQDTAGNMLAAISSTNVVDGVAPTITTRATKDLDGDGKIDSIELTFSESINDATVGTNLTASGYNVTGFDTNCAGSTANDNIICALVSEQSLSDTSSTPITQIVSNTSLGDFANNLYPIDNTSKTSIDNVGPIIIGARYDAGNTGVADDKIYVTFSENVNSATIGTNPATSFVINAGGSFGTTSTIAITSGNTATISLGSDATALTAGTSQIGIASGVIQDALGNGAPISGPQNMVTLSAPVVINEVMWSGTGANAYQYIELRNLAATSADISGWIIRNAGGNNNDVTLPAATISANGFYLIASSDNTGPLSITPDFVTPSLALNPNGQFHLSLVDGVNTIDTAVANPWPAGNINLPASMERTVFPGDGQDPANWYTASASVGFDNGLTARGTPALANMFDTVAPTINSKNIADNTLFPTGTGITLDYIYSDNIAIDTSATALTLEKWNGTSYINVTNTDVNSSGATASGASYIFNPLAFGRYRANLIIRDTSGNTTIQPTTFAVDKLEMTISTAAADIGTINQNGITYAPDVIVTVKTLGAGFSLTLGGSGAMNSGINTLQSWSGATQNGFGFDYSESGSGGSLPFGGTLQPINPSVLTTYASGNIDANGLQKTFTYTVRYGAKIVGTQAAGSYAANTSFGIVANY